MTSVHAIKRLGKSVWVGLGWGHNQIGYTVMVGLVGVAVGRSEF